MTFFFLFILGICVGSFVNVLIDRLPDARPFVRSRSICQNCKKELLWFDLIPLLSFIKLTGKCRHCGSKIPARIFFVELLMGILFVFLYWYYLTVALPLPALVVLLTITPLFVALFFADLEFGVLPDKLIIVIMLVLFLYYFLFDFSIFVPQVLSGLVIFVFFFLLFIVTRGRGMGFGDVKLAFVLGLFLGLKLSIVALYLAFLTGAAVSLILVLWGKKKLQGSTIPFGPFLVGSTLFSALFGDYFFQFFINAL